jgi:cell division protein FtsL
VRLLNFCLVILLALAAAYVYEIKFDATLRASRVAEMRSEVRRERDAIAALRAEWARLENPSRLEALARRHLSLRPAELWQLDSLDNLPERPLDRAPSAADEATASVGTDSDAAAPSDGSARARWAR